MTIIILDKLAHINAKGILYFLVGLTHYLISLDLPPNGLPRGAKQFADRRNLMTGLMKLNYSASL